MKQIPNGRILATFGAVIKSMILSPGAVLGGLFLLAFVMPAAAQQTVAVTTAPARVTAPFNFSGTNSVSVNVQIAGGSNEVDIAIAGLPAGATAIFGKTAFTNNGATTLTFGLTNVAEGLYTLVISASGAANSFIYLPLQVGDVWTGTGANMNWSTAGNWNGGVVPGANDEVIFNQGGAQTTATNTNSIVDITTTIASLRFAMTNSSTNFQTVLINPGVTLNITGTNSLSELRDLINFPFSMNVTIAGAAGTLNVANESGNFALLTDGNVKSLLDMHNLGNFTGDVNRFAIGDQLAYPNFTNLTANATGGSIGRPKQYSPTWDMAATNVMKAVFVDPYNYTNSTNRAYAFELGNNGNQQTANNPIISMGVSNLFLMDSFCIAGNGGETALLNFNTNLLSINPNPTAYFRNTDGVSRMSMFAICDLATSFTNGTGNTKANAPGVDFADGHGFVSALVDRFIMSRDAPVSILGMTAQSAMELGQGIFDVNTAIIGDQSQGDQLGLNYCQATLTVSNTAVFKVNNDLELGYETADLNDTSDPGSTFGLINISLGGTVMANQIGVGGVTKTSGLVGVSDGHGGLNQINISGGGILIVSNTIADATPNGSLGLLNMTGNGTLELFIDGSINRTNAYIKTITTTGSGNTLKIGGISNLIVPAQVPLIAYAVGTPTFNLSLPPGFSGAIINNGAGSTIDAFIVSGTPKTLVWRGFQSAIWNSTDKNWLDLNTGLQTNFANLDNVSFDDTLGIPTTISLSGLVIPGSVGITNSINSYTFTGPGTTSGSATLIKTGSASLEIDANTTLSVALNQGLLTGSGTVNSITSAAGTTVLYAGTVNAGLICSGTVTLSGILSGGIDIKSGGILTNLNTINGPITLETGSFVNNEATIQNMFPSGSVATNAFLLNSGFINDGGASPTANNGTLTINLGGTFEDTGAGSLTLFRLTLASGCTFIPGGGGLGTTTINSDGSSASFPGRLSMANGSRTLLYVNGGNYTKLTSGCVDYGPSQTAQSQNGSTLVITNLGAPYTAGEVFQFFGNSFNGGNPLPDGTSTNSFPIIVPATPGPGLVWDLSHLWPGGNIGVIVPPIVTLTNNGIARSNGTNIVTSLSWSSDQAGWVVETQSRPITLGLSLNNTNWTRITGTEKVISTNITNPFQSGTNAVFYRLVFP